MAFRRRFSAGGMAAGRPGFGPGPGIAPSLGFAPRRWAGQPPGMALSARRWGGWAGRRGPWGFPGYAPLPWWQHHGADWPDSVYAQDWDPLREVPVWDDGYRESGTEAADDADRLVSDTLRSLRDGSGQPAEEGFEEDPGEEEEADLSVIGPVDDRVQEVQTNRFPWNTMVHLCRDFGDGNCAGCSGALVSPRHVLTAAHCVWNLKHRAAPKRILVLPGRSSRKTLPYGSIEARRYWVPRGFVDGPDRNEWDWSIIELPRPFPRIRRFLPLRPLSDAVLKQLSTAARVTVAGYPSDRPLGTLWRHAERLVRFSPRRLFHTVDTCPGHSGSPIIARLGDSAAIIGVHTAGLLDAEGRSFGCKRGAILAPPGSVNSGVRATPRMVDALTKPKSPHAGPAALVLLP